MRIHWPSFWSAFAGKIFAAIFLAICVFLGFGPVEWIKFMIQELPQWITPSLARIGFLGLALLTFGSLIIPIKRKKQLITQISTINPEPTSADIILRREYLSEKRKHLERLINKVDQIWKGIEEYSKDKQMVPSDRTQWDCWTRTEGRFVEELGEIHNFAERSFPDQRFNLSQHPEYDKNPYIYRVPGDELIDDMGKKLEYRRLFDMHKYATKETNKMLEILDKELNELRIKGRKHGANQ